MLHTRGTFRLFAGFLCVLPLSAAVGADVVTYFGYENAIELKNGTTRVVLCPDVGGRVLEYSFNGKNVLYLSDDEKKWKPGDKPHSGAGRFDIGPELVIPRRSTLWSGRWTGKVTGPVSARLESQTDDGTGVRLIREFRLDDTTSHLRCTQTIVNESDSVKEWCHWSRTFAVGRGICVIPLSDPAKGPMSRFPAGYVMYEEGSLINMKPADGQIRRVENSLIIYPTPRRPKLGFDSYTGEIAYLAPNDLLFVKRFPTFPDRVYNEAAGLTISVWYPDRPMVELEPIGPRERLKPGESASFTEDWYLRPYDFPGIDATIDPGRLKSVTDAMR